MLLDAAGLSLFAMAGAAKSLDRGIHLMAASLMGAVTGAGGGAVRDILLARIPSILRVDVYVVAALAGAALMIAGDRRGFARGRTMMAGGVACFALRVVSVWQHWNLPQAP